MRSRNMGEQPVNDEPTVWPQMPALPSPYQRWTVRRKAAVVESVRGGWIPIEEACRLYNISVDEFLNWERDIDRNGVPGCERPLPDLSRHQCPARLRRAYRPGKPISSPRRSWPTRYFSDLETA